MSEREMMLRRLSSIQFAMFELHLFLDTHPGDREAAKKYEDLMAQADALKAEYEAKYGPLSHSNASTCKWAWIKDPWPWETERDGE